MLNTRLSQAVTPGVGFTSSKSFLCYRHQSFAGQLVGREYFGDLPSPDDRPRILRQIHGMRNKRNHFVFSLNFFMALGSIPGGSGSRYRSS